jgi:hypothetical protein
LGVLLVSRVDEELLLVLVSWVVELLLLVLRLNNRSKATFVETVPVRPNPAPITRNVVDGLVVIPTH